MLQWPKYGQLRDTAEVLLAESGETYAFIEKVRFASPPPLSLTLSSFSPSVSLSADYEADASGSEPR